jgi:aldehyde:ferredoxin oxidoreductase
MGKIITVDLSSGTVRDEVVPESVYENNLSGLGLAAHIRYDRIPAHADPLGPENILGFVSGLLTGTGSLFSGRWMVTAKSPLTGGGVMRPTVDGTLPPAIKWKGTTGSLHPASVRTMPALM